MGPNLKTQGPSKATLWVELTCTYCFDNTVMQLKWFSCLKMNSLLCNRYYLSMHSCIQPHNQQFIEINVKTLLFIDNVFIFMEFSQYKPCTARQTLSFGCPGSELNFASFNYAFKYSSVNCSHMQAEPNRLLFEFYACKLGNYSLDMQFQ